MLHCWTLTSGKMGCLKQAIGIAKALNLHFEEKVYRQRSPWHLLPAHWDPDPVKHAKVGSDELTRPLPDIIIGSGTRCIPFMLAAHKASHGKIALVYTQHPHISPKHFDVVIAPHHDRLTGPNVISILGAPHDISPMMLAKAAAQSKTLFKHLPKPILSICLGGSTKQYAFTAKRAQQLSDRLSDIIQQHGTGVIITASRRTGEDNTQMLYQRLAALPNVHFHQEGQPNPYYAMLGLAEKIMVTNDSISMMSETTSSGKPVFLLPLPEFKPPAKIQRFIDEAIARRHCQYTTTDLTAQSFQPLNEVERIIPEVKRLLAPKVRL